MDAHPDYASLIQNVPELMQVDFSSLRQPRYNYADQTKIDKHRVHLLAACAVHYNLDFGLVTRYLGSEYTAKWRDVDTILTAVEDVVSEEDFEHMKRILTVGCPAEFNWEEPLTNKETFIRRGNNPLIKANIEAVNKTLNKEEQNSHLIPFPRYGASIVCSTSCPTNHRKQQREIPIGLGWYVKALLLGDHNERDH